MSNEKIYFLTHDFISKLQALDENTKPQWGVMNVQQMIEHMSDSVRIANHKFRIDQPVNPPEVVAKSYAFMMTDRPFRPNTKNSMMGEIPEPVKQPNKQAAIEELQNELDDFIKLFNDNPQRIVLNPFFGELNFDEWLHLLSKHAKHHLTQFGVDAN